MANITLTFDNGPEPSVTPHVLDLLARRDVRTTFFVVGERAVRPECRPLLARARAAGHWVGNHTWSHPMPLGLMDGDSALAEVTRAEAALAFLDLPQRLFRPVGGGGRIGPHMLHPRVLDHLIAHRYTCVIWNDVPGDWRDPDGWLDRALEGCRSRDWTLMVLHDVAGGAMRHLEEFLTRALGDGHTFTQQFPASCLPIVEGEVVLPLEGFVTGLGHRLPD